MKTTMKFLHAATILLAACASVLCMNACGSSAGQDSTADKTANTNTAMNPLPKIYVKPGSESVKGCTLVLQNDTATDWSYNTEEFRLLYADTYQAVPFLENSAINAKSDGLMSGETVEQTLDFEGHLTAVAPGDYFLEKELIKIDAKISYELTIRIPLHIDDNAQ